MSQIQVAARVSFTLPMTQSLTGKAIGYLADELPRLIRYLDDGRLDVSNVLCENAIDLLPQNAPV